MDPLDLLRQVASPGYRPDIVRLGDSDRNDTSRCVTFDQVVPCTDTSVTGKAEKKERKAAPRKHGSRGRNWCFTEYNVDLNYLSGNTSKIRYLKRQLEKCPTTGRIHYQGWLQLVDHQTVMWMKKNISSSAHWEPCRGTEEANDSYCSKLKSQIGQPETHGAYKTQGSCATMSELASLVQDGKSLQQLCVEAPSLMLMHSKKVLDFRRMVNPARPRAFKKMYFLHGPPGSSKTPYALKHWPAFVDGVPNAYYAKDCYQGWADSYDGQDTIVFDEFNGEYELASMLQLTSEVPYSLPVKGGFVPCCATTVVFISYAVSPANFYAGDPAWIKRLNKFGTQINFKVDRTNWRVMDVVDSDTVMVPVPPSTVSHPEGVLLLGPEGVVLPKQVRGTLSPPGGNLAQTSNIKDLLGMGTIVPLPLANGHGIRAVNAYAVGMDPHLSDEKKVIMPRLGRRSAVTAEEVLSSLSFGKTVPNNSPSANAMHRDSIGMVDDHPDDSQLYDIDEDPDVVDEDPLRDDCWS